MITDIAGAFDQTHIMTITDSWFGNNVVQTFEKSTWPAASHDIPASLEQ